MKFTVVAIFMIGSIVVGFFIYKNFFDYSSIFAEACEEKLKERLKAPATYNRIEVHYSVEQVDAQEALGKSRKSKANEALRTMYERTPPYRHRLFITYDAANAFGTPIRSVATCDTYKISAKSLGKSDVRMTSLLRINGKTNIDWMIDRVSE